MNNISTLIWFLRISATRFFKKTFGYGWLFASIPRFFSNFLFHQSYITSCFKTNCCPRFCLRSLRVYRLHILCHFIYAKDCGETLLFAFGFGHVLIWLHSGSHIAPYCCQPEYWSGAEGQWRRGGRQFRMTSWYWSAFRITGILWGESEWILHPKGQ